MKKKISSLYILAIMASLSSITLMSTFCGSSASIPIQPGNTNDSHEIVIQNSAFEPKSITITKGTTVTWINRDNTLHMLRSGTPLKADGLFTSGDMGNFETFRYTFDKPGTYFYFCQIHPGLHGTIVVQ